LLVISNGHHPGTSMPSGGHPPHQLAASFMSGFTHSPGCIGLRLGSANLTA
jgi:hypothetical protein